MPWLDKIERLPGWLKSLAILAMIAALGYADYLSGFEISFSIFYLAPVVTAAWILGRRAATLFAVLSATSWLWADIYSGHMYSHPIIPAWNAIMRMGVFLMVDSRINCNVIGSYLITLAGGSCNGGTEALSSSDKL